MATPSTDLDRIQAIALSCDRSKNRTNFVEALHQVPLFAQLDSDRFKFVEWGKFKQLHPKEILAQEGDPPSCFWVVLEGEINTTKKFEKREVPWKIFGSQTYFGHELILLNMPFRVTCSALVTSWLFEIETDAFWRMLEACPSITRELLSNTAKRMQHFDSFSQNARKSMEIDTLTTGLAQELNNPVSLCYQVSQQLRETFEVLQALTLKLSQPQITNLQQQSLADLLRDRQEHTTNTSFQLDPLTRVEQEEEVTNWLETHGIAESWKLASAIVETGLDRDKLDTIIKRLGFEFLGEFSLWLEGTLTGIELLNQIEQSTRRISELIESVKVCPGQTPPQEIDLHESIESVLAFLDPKIEPEVVVTRKYDYSLPRLRACSNELNQVWLNLIDNAIAAVGEQGQIWVRTFRENNEAIVEIADNGFGISPEIQPYIFEPFFSTKEVGEGTGLGLHIAHRIIVELHGGVIDIFTDPDATCFQVRLPIIFG